MVEWLSRREAPPCPKCRNDVSTLLEWDDILQRYVCAVCCHQWAPRHSFDR
jgi:hypothetical protein